MAVGQSITRELKGVTQSALGTLGSSGSQRLRRTSFVLDLENGTYESNEIDSSQQSSGATQGPDSVTGTYNTEISPGSNAEEWALLLRRDFTAVTAITGLSLTIAGSGPTYTITRGSGSFFTDVVKKGYVTKITAGSVNANNLNKDVIVIGVTATVLTVIVRSGALTLTAEGPIASCTLTFGGKTTWAPFTGHTNKYRTYEMWEPNVPSSELFGDVKPASAAVTIPATGIPTCNFAMAGLSRTDGASEVLTSPTAASTTNILQSKFGRIVINGTPTRCTNIQITVDGRTTPGDGEVGETTLSDLQRGKIAVSGQFSAKFSSTTLSALRRNQTVVTLIVGGADSGLAAADYVVFTMPAIKIMTDPANDENDQQVVRTYNFTGQRYAAGGAGTDSNQTIFQIVDSQAA